MRSDVDSFKRCSHSNLSKDDDNKYERVKSKKPWDLRMASHSVCYC